MADEREELQQLCLGVRQCGVSLPGGADVLVHIRRCLEPALFESDEAIALLDLDLRNAFPSLEWHSIREALEEEFPVLLPWARWCHQDAASVQLPTGEWTLCDRGAEQGDLHGPIQCAVVVLRAARRAREAVETAGLGVWDAWYMDDGQVALPVAAAGIYAQVRCGSS